MPAGFLGFLFFFLSLYVGQTPTSFCFDATVLKPCLVSFSLSPLFLPGKEIPEFFFLTGKTYKHTLHFVR